MSAAPIFALLLLFSAADVEGPKLAPIYPTPQTIVERMLELGRLRAGEKMCDLGSGDGRIVILAAQKFHANATGIEIDDDLHRRSSESIRKLGLSKTARIVHGDLLKQRYNSYDLVTVYLEQSSNDVIQPLLERELKPGARVVSHNYEFRGWRATKMETIPDESTGENHTIFLYER